MSYFFPPKFQNSFTSDKIDNDQILIARVNVERKSLCGGHQTGSVLEDLFLEFLFYLSCDTGTIETFDHSMG